MSTTAVRRAPVPAVLLILPLLALTTFLGWLNVSTSSLRLRNGRWVSHSLDLIARIERTRNALSDVRLSELSAQPSAEDPASRLARRRQEAGLLRSLVAEDPDQKAAVLSLAAALETARTAAFPAELSQTETTLDGMVREEEGRLRIHQERLRLSVVANERCASVAVVAMALSLFAVAALLWREERLRRLADALADRERRMESRAAEQERAAMERANAHLRNLFEAAFEGLALTQNGVFVDANAAFLQMFGYDSLEALRQVTPENLAHAESRDLVIRKRSESDDRPYEAVLLRNGDRPFEAELRGRIIEFDGRPARLTAVRDLSDQKAAAAALAESEARLALAQSVAGVGSWSFEVASSRVSWSAEMFRLFGLDPDEGEPPLEEILVRYHLEDVKALIDAFALCSQDGTPYDVTARLSQYGDAHRWMRSIGQAEFDGDDRIVRVFGTVADVHAIKRLEEDVRERAEALRQSEAALRALLRAAPVILFTADPQGVVTLFKGAGLTALGLRPDQAIGRSIFDLNPDPESAAALELALDGEIVSFEAWHGSVCLHQEIRPLTDESGELTGVIGVAVDVTDIKTAERSIAAHAAELEAANGALAENQRLLDERLTEVADMNVELESQRFALNAANERLEMLATTDGLTGLKNQRTFRERLEEAYERAWQQGTELSLLMLDIDHFKGYNDTFGHPAGDEALRTVASVLTDLARSNDVAARNGGEEFALLLPGVGEAGASLVAERLREAVEAQDWPLRTVTVSIGVATLRSAFDTQAALVEAADQALYRAKKAGRNRVVAATFEEERRPPFSEKTAA